MKGQIRRPGVLLCIVAALALAQGCGRKAPPAPKAGEILWKGRVGEAAPGHPSVSGGVLYFTKFEPFRIKGFILWGRAPSIIAVDVRTGKRRWHYSSPSQIRQGPSLFKDTVYFTPEDGHLRALDRGTGKTRWVSPVSVLSARLVEQVLYGWGKEVQAIEPRTGKQLWNHTFSMYVEACPWPQAGLVFAGTSGGAVYGLDSKTGDEKWRTEGTGYIFYTLVPGDDAVVIRDTSGRMCAIDIKTGAQRWCYEPSQGGSGSPAVAGGMALTEISYRSIDAIDMATGERKWSFPEVTTDSALTFPNFSTLERTQDLVYFGANDGYLRAVDARTGAVKWKFRPPGGVAARPVIAGAAVYLVSTGPVLYELDTETGEERWHAQLPSGVASYLAVGEGVVAYRGTDGYVYAINAPTGDAKH